MSDDLIEHLASDMRPVRRGAVQTRLALGLLAGAVVAAMVMIPMIGFRPDIGTAWTGPVFWIKFGYTLLLTMGGFWALERLARPGGSGRGALWAVGAVFVGVVILAVAQLTMSPPEMTETLVIGGTNLICPLFIVALSLPVFVLTMGIVRTLAPTNLTLAGLAAGLLSGGAGAWVYAFHCGENGLPFLAIWYTLGIAIVAAIGALTGRMLLRW